MHVSAVHVFAVHASACLCLQAPLRDTQVGGVQRNPSTPQARKMQGTTPVAAPPSVRRSEGAGKVKLPSVARRHVSILAPSAWESAVEKGLTHRASHLEGRTSRLLLLPSGQSAMIGAERDTGYMSFWTMAV